MALMNCSFYSEVLGLNTEMSVIVPQQTTSQIGLEGYAAKNLHPTLYLLHGLSDDHTIWIRRTSIERYVAKLGLAVVIPQMHRSFYTDMASGLAYWTFLTEELPKLARGFFPLSDKREDNYVAGLSMGGYGAFKWALTYPERFAAAASLSGALDIGNDLFRQRLAQDMQLIFGEQPVSGTENDLLHLLKLGEDRQGLKPKLYQCCGTEDFLYKDNLTFRNAAQHSTYELHYEEGPGEHEWGYWDARIQDVLAWLPLRHKQK